MGSVAYCQFRTVARLLFRKPIVSGEHHEIQQKGVGRKRKTISQPPQYVKVTAVVYLKDEPHFAVYGKRCKATGVVIPGANEKRLDVTDWTYKKPAVPAKLP